MYLCLHMFGNSFFSSFEPLGPLGLIIVRHFPKKCGNAVVWQCLVIVTHRVVMVTLHPLKPRHLSHTLLLTMGFINNLKANSAF